MKRLGPFLIIFIMVLSGCGHSKSAKKLAREHYARAYSRSELWDVRPPWFERGHLSRIRTEGLTRAIQLDPRNADYHFSMAMWYGIDDPKGRHEYEIAARLSRRYRAAYLYFQVFGDGVSKIPMLTPEIDRIMRLAREADPKNALLDYQLAWLYANAGKLQMAHELLLEGNRKPEVHLYINPAWSSLRIHPPLTVLSTNYAPSIKFRQLALKLCEPDLSRYNIVRGASFPSPRHRDRAILPESSLAQGYIKHGQMTKAIQVCHDVSRFGTRIVSIGPEQKAIDALVGVAIRGIALSAEANYCGDAGDSCGIRRAKVEFDRQRRATDKFSRRLREESLPHNPYYKVIMVLGGYSSIQATSRGMMARPIPRVLVWLEWLAPPILFLLPALAAVIFFGKRLYERPKESPLQRIDAGYLILILLALLYAGYITRLFYSGWNPVAIVADWQVKKQAIRIDRDYGGEVANTVRRL